MLRHNIPYVSLDSHTFWLQNPSIPTHNRSVVAEICSFYWKHPCIFDRKKSVFTPLLLCSMDMTCCSLIHIWLYRYIFWLQNDTLCWAFSCEHTEIQLVTCTYPIFETRFGFEPILCEINQPIMIDAYHCDRNTTSDDATTTTSLKIKWQWRYSWWHTEKYKQLFEKAYLPHFCIVSDSKND